MNKFGYLLASTALAGVMAMPGTAEAQSAKAAGAQSQAVFLSATDTAWTTLASLNSAIKVPNGKTLAIDTSLECGVYTSTKNKGKGGSEDITSAGAKVKVRVQTQKQSGGGWVTASPGVIIFCDRQQTVTTKFGGVIADLTACVGGNTTGCVLTDEEITIAIRTVGANAFNFFQNISDSDTYSVRVQAMIDVCMGSAADTTAGTTFGECLDDGNSDANAFAFISGGSIFIEEARFVRGEQP